MRTRTRSYYIDQAAAFTLKADTASNEELAAVYRKQARVNKILANASQAELYALFDTGIYNGVIKGYIKEAMAAACISAEVRDNILSNITLMLDTITAETADEYHAENNN